MPFKNDIQSSFDKNLLESDKAINEQMNND